LNLYPRKGAILPGADADMTVWDPKASKTISARSQVSAIDYNVFEGTKVIGLPRIRCRAAKSSIATARCRPSWGAAASSSASRFPRRRAAQAHKEYTAVAGVGARETTGDGRSGGCQAQARPRTAKAPPLRRRDLRSVGFVRFNTADGPVQAA